jgi:uncharacterized pyridoxamine 5'-phosphate oxidase family protein
MNLQDCIDFANQNPVCSLATVEGDQPRVRILGFWFADETGFYFQTSTTKELHGQLEANPKVEVCFYRQEKNGLGTTLRVSGRTRFVTDQQYKEKAMADRPFLKTFGLTVDHPALCIFKISRGEAYFWTLESNQKQKEVIEF